MSKVLVVGAGFLGVEIISQMAPQYDVVGTSRSAQEGKVLFDVFKPETYSNLPEEIAHVVYCVSADAGDMESYQKAYFSGVEKVISYFSTKNLQSFTFISSTGVYSESHGRVIDESSDLLTDLNDKSSYIVKGEGLVLGQDFTLGRVCRLSGIYGPGRDYFIRFSEQYSKVYYEDLPIYSNRIHKIDAGRAIKFLIEKNIDGVWNITDSCPSERLETLNYIRQLKNLDLVPLSEPYLEALETSTIGGKIVSNRKLIQAGFKFLYPSYKEGYAEMLGVIEDPE